MISKLWTCRHNNYLCGINNHRYEHKCSDNYMLIHIYDWKNMWTENLFCFYLYELCFFLKLILSTFNKENVKQINKQNLRIYHTVDKWINWRTNLKIIKKKNLIRIEREMNLNWKTLNNRLTTHWKFYLILVLNKVFYRLSKWQNKK